MAKYNSFVISVSRRTDIPAYYSEWFVNRIDKGFVAYPNPYSNIPVFISLKPEHVKAFVFWTRNPKPLFVHLDKIDDLYNKRHYIHFTINGLPNELESRNPKIDYAINSAEYLAKRYGPNYVQWRFDPIVVSNISKKDYILERFEYLCYKLNGITKRCYFSFVDMYDKTKRNFALVERENNITFDTNYTNMATDIKYQVALLDDMKKIARSNNIALYACAEERIEKIEGINKAHCVDGDLIELFSQSSGLKADPSPSRIGCGCIESRDIGFYDSCPHGCIYCYANMNPEIALENARKYQLDGFPYDKLEMPETKNIYSDTKNDNQIKLFP